MLLETAFAACEPLDLLLEECDSSMPGVFLTSPRARALITVFELQAVIQFDNMDTSGSNFFQFWVASSHLPAWASNWEVAKTGHSQKPAPGSLWIGWHPGKVD